ncbi:kinase-like protein [Gonapodya prolifera JEL478]|uniref:dual-specificity kinase n=1 Tax=Gonapodya prolifera (strain JEL478) TaxID=1344416 RepID=A0A139AHR2_GONPJ|nr:kinase-like protein [Gonapodya prolifera JEL478]|eukprot:KXS16268.1 kinase-like protein [Gonapodya prolifera JEL478]
MGGLTGNTVLQKYYHYLTPYERTEILTYPAVWFIGHPTAEKVGSGRARSKANNDLNKPDPSAAGGGDASDPPGADGLYNSGYDDARGDYVLTLEDHVGYRYEVVSLLGKGSFGQVVKCWDHRERRFVALKIIRNKKRFEKQGMVEVKVLDRLRHADSDNMHNIIHMGDSFHFRGHLCITSELLGINLYEWLKAGSFKGVQLHVIRKFCTQVLQCLVLLHRLRIVHCDLKPENILLRDITNTAPSAHDSNHHSSRGQPPPPATDDGRSSSPHDPPLHNGAGSWYGVKVIDFGSSCFEHEKVYTYVQSRFYRSPEVILGINYSMAIDMWSLGCILAELFTGYPLFPGENEQEQLACIMEVKGVPDKEFIDRGTRKKLFFDSSSQPRLYPNSKGKKRRPSTKTLPAVLRCTDQAFLDFIDRCLVWDPHRRMTPNQALEHPWIVGQQRSAIPRSIRDRSVDRSAGSRARQPSLARRVSEKRREEYEYGASSQATQGAGGMAMAAYENAYADGYSKSKGQQLASSSYLSTSYPNIASLGSTNHSSSRNPTTSTMSTTTSSTPRQLPPIHPNMHRHNTNVGLGVASNPMVMSPPKVPVYQPSYPSATSNVMSGYSVVPDIPGSSSMSSAYAPPVGIRSNPYLTTSTGSLQLGLVGTSATRSSTSGIRSSGSMVLGAPSTGSGSSNSASRKLSMDGSVGSSPYVMNGGVPGTPSRRTGGGGGTDQFAQARVVAGGYSVRRSETDGMGGYR